MNDDEKKRAANRERQRKWREANIDIHRERQKERYQKKRADKENYLAISLIIEDARLKKFNYIFQVSKLLNKKLTKTSIAQNILNEGIDTLECEMRTISKQIDLIVTETNEGKDNTDEEK